MVHILHTPQEGWQKTDFISKQDNLEGMYHIVQNISRENWWIHTQNNFGGLSMQNNKMIKFFR